MRGFGRFGETVNVARSGADRERSGSMPADTGQTGTGATTVRDVTYELLRAHGLTTIFGNLGSTEETFLASFPSDFRYVLGLQEASVMAMADGYAQAVRRPALVHLH